MKVASVEVRVLYGDTDQMGVGYYANYFRWFEQGRAEYLRRLGLPYRDIEEKGFCLPVSEAYCRYLASARYDDLLVVGASLAQVGKATVKFDYIITRKGNGQPLARGFTRHFCLDREGRVSPLPSFLAEVLRESGQKEEGLEG